jgi:hypothetical protein
MVNGVPGPHHVLFGGRNCSKASVFFRFRSQQYQCAWPLPKDTCSSTRDSTASRRRDVVHAKRCTTTATTTTPCTCTFLRLRAATIRVHTVNANFPRRNVILIYVRLNGAPSSRRVLVARTVAHGYDPFGPLLSSSSSSSSFLLLFRVTRPHGHQHPCRASSTYCCPLLATGPSSTPF